MRAKFMQHQFLLLWLVAWVSKATEPEFTRASVAILKDLMNVDPELGVKFIRQKQLGNEDHFGDRIISYIPQLLRMGTLDIIQHIPRQYWVDLATKRRWRRVRNGLLLMFSGEIATNLESLLTFVDEQNGISADSIPLLLEVWIQEQPYSYSRRLGVLGSMPEELVHYLLDGYISMAEELTLAQTCHWLNDHLKPRIREKYQEVTVTSGQRKFRFSIRKIYKNWTQQEAGSHKEAVAEDFLCQMKPFRKFQRCFFEGEAEFKMPHGYTCLFDYLIHTRLNPEILYLLLEQYPERILENFEAKFFVSAWYMDYPDYVLKSVIERVENVPSDVLYVVSDRRFSDQLLEAVLKRFKWRLTVGECNYMLTRLRTKTLIEKVLDRLPKGFYHFGPSQIKHFLRMQLDNERIQNLLLHFRVNLGEGGTLFDALLRRKLASAPLLRVIANNARTLVITSSSIELAVQLECDDEVLEALIGIAQKQTQPEKWASEESSSDDWILRARTFGSGALDIAMVD